MSTPLPIIDAQGGGRLTAGGGVSAEADSRVLGSAKTCGTTQRKTAPAATLRIEGITQLGSHRRAAALRLRAALTAHLAGAPA